MKKFSTFIFESFDFDEKKLEARFYYSFDNGAEIFEEVINFKCEGFQVDENALSMGNKVIFKNFLFQLHLALGISYYKLFPTEELIVQSGRLDEDQVIFWEKFYKNGLGEFFITNNIDPNGLVRFKNSNFSENLEDIMFKNNYIESSQHFIEQKSLLLWGGGKDSIVSYSLLKERKEFDLFVFGKIDDIKRKTADISGENVFLVHRLLSKNLFKLNQQGYYNGHVPITGIIAFVAFVAGYLYGYSNIILSNEKSASEENTTWKGLKINHQYSKSLEFESDLKEYGESYMTQGIKYFSLLRGMYEYKIASIFSEQKEFFSEFSSCNRNFKINSISSSCKGEVPQRGDGGIKLWCGECEKCCFVFLILSPFLSKSELVEIFGENLFEKQSLENTFRELIGLVNYKPFECVGTYEECLLAAKKACQRFHPLPLVLKNIQTEVLEKCTDEIEKKLENKLLKIAGEDIIPQKFKELLLGKKEKIS